MSPQYSLACRLAHCDRLAGVSGQCVLPGRYDYPRLDHPQRSNLRPQSVARNLVVDCHRLLLDHLQHSPCLASSIDRLVEVHSLTIDSADNDSPEGMVLILHILGFFAIIIPLWVMAPRSNASDALLNFTNNGGWPTKGLSAMIGLLAPMAVLVGYDCSVHMCKLRISLPSTKTLTPFP